MSKALFNKNSSFGKLAFAALLALTFCMVHPASTAQAKKRSWPSMEQSKFLVRQVDCQSKLMANPRA